MGAFDLFFNNLSEFSRCSKNDIVLFSKLGARRNLYDYKFKDREKSENLKKISYLVKKYIDKNNFHILEGRKLSEKEIDFLCEHFLIAKNENSDFKNSFFLIKKDGNFMAATNLSEHIEAFELFNGVDFLDRYKYIDNFLKKIKTKYAYLDDFGFLMSDPLKSGYGFYLLSILHLPALRISNKIEALKLELKSFNLQLDTLNESKAPLSMDFYSLYREINVGDFKKIMEIYGMVLSTISNKEIQERSSLLNNSKIELEDKIFRALGVIRFSRLIGQFEAMENISLLKFGLDLGYKLDCDYNHISKAFFMARDYYLKILDDNRNINFLRASILRNIFN